LIKGGQVDVLAEEVEEDVGVDLSAGVVCKKYEEPESCGSAADFLLGVEMEGDPTGRMDVEGGALMAVETDLFLNTNDSNKCQCPSPIVESTTAVDDANVGTDFVVVDILAVDDNTNVGKDQVHKDALAVSDVHILADCVDDDQVDEDVLAADDVDILADFPSKPIQTRPKTSNKFSRGKRRGGNRKTTLTIDTILPTPQAADVGGVACHHPPAISKKSTKKQIISSLNTIEKKRQMTEDKMVVVTKKLHTAANDCKTLAVLAQERRRESNLALQHADCPITGMCDKMTTRLRQAARDVADAQESAARDVADAQESAARDVAGNICNGHYGRTKVPLQKGMCHSQETC